MHRPRLEGLEHLPRDRPFLLVANHSGGMALAELSSFAALYAERLGGEPPLAGFALPLGFHGPMAPLHRALGSVPSTYAHAYEALEGGASLLVFPGGDHEVLRPIWKAHEVDFAGRVGFLRIAKTAGVPIVPMGIRGSHFSAPILLRSKVLPWLLVFPRLLGLKRFAISVLGILGALPILFSPLALGWKIVIVWLWMGSPVTLLPIIPSTIRFRIGAPLLPETLFAGEGDEDELLERAYPRVVQTVQQLVSDLGEG
ncbi:1-acyl-sn-glycerol-3-phosphate acyltransferase [Pseudenhygromyxa sp. WMMC2535]|nr:1-acyl-sn-glycerol-3-phosphate acyltransferase [Pseudenhygromyxa sp. WMMC2535]NVB37020.1 1-acyl-sn-glycerol-3-phosphate acyltransferase [Pseudenhygromyxa sp. WMMC2535]